jgi:hypothetical protein
MNEVTLVSGAVFQMPLPRRFDSDSPPFRDCANKCRRSGQPTTCSCLRLPERRPTLMTPTAERRLWEPPVTAAWFGRDQNGDRGREYYAE